jgi:hypothetical protein
VSDTVFGFKIEPVSEGWRWVTFAKDGDVALSGVAPTKAVAAACIIRALTRDCTRLAA